LKKKIILLCLIITGILFGFNLNGNNQGGKSFLLKGNIKGLNNASAKLTYFNRDDFKSTTLDSGKVVDGKFELHGSVAGPMEVSLIFNVEGKSLVSNLFIENSNIQVQLDTSKYNYLQGNYKWLTCEVRGSKTQEEYDNYLSLGKELRDELKPYQEEYHRLSVQFNSVKNNSNNSQKDSLINKVKDIDALMAGINSKLDSIDQNFIKTHPASQISSYLLSQKIKDIGLEKDIAFYSAFTPEVKEGIYGVSAAKQIEKLKKASPGAEAPLFSKEDLKGNMINLKDFRGKYVLLDFWASWCVPCRAGHPHLLELYKKYHKKGLEIIGIGDDDYTQPAWKEAIEKDGIGIWYQVLRGYKRDKTTHMPVDQGLDGPYDISSIPAHFLIDKNGIIIGRYAEDEAPLDAKLKEIFGN
jgi:thiol-disulfide isomerase/thioredoxin